METVDCSCRRQLGCGDYGEGKGDSEGESGRRYTWGEPPGDKGEQKALKLCVVSGACFERSRQVKLNQVRSKTDHGWINLKN